LPSSIFDKLLDPSRMRLYRTARSADGGPSYRSVTDENLAYQTEYYQQHPEVMAGFAALARYRPSVIEGYLALRREAFNVGSGAALSPKIKELCILAMEC